MSQVSWWIRGSALFNTQHALRILQYSIRFFKNQADPAAASVTDCQSNIYYITLTDIFRYFMTIFYPSTEEQSPQPYDELTLSGDIHDPSF